MTDCFYLAPLRGVTDSIFRTAYEKHFGTFDFMMAPFITTVKGKTVKHTHLKDVSGDENDRSRVIPQILGNDLETLNTLADAFKEHGYHTVNLNMGCPHPPVSRKKRGSGLLPHPELVASLLEALCSRENLSVSVKVRLGLQTAADLPKLMPVLNALPLTEVILHPRTGKQGYTGTVDLDRFEESAAVCKHTLVYNGDIDSLATFQRLKTRFPLINRWMIGRGIVCHPGLLHELRTGKEALPDPMILAAFHQELYAANEKRLCGPSHLLGKMKEFWSYFSSSFPESKSVYQQITRSQTLADYHHKVGVAFSTIR